ncbi:MAG TPA: glycosyltransferase family 9 protein [Longimicrobiales bacterium]|nr:glycosyltransferase family 9 protein [Longimicrobiales bacterium]
MTDGNALTVTDGTRIVIVMLSAIGDAVHVLPVVTALKRHAPGCHITWVLQPGAASMVRGHPDVDDVVIFRRKLGVDAFRDIARELRARRIDILIDLQTSLKAGIITGLSGAPVRLGFDRRRSKDLNTLFTNHRIPEHPNQHVQDQYFEFLAALGVDPEPVQWNLGPWPDERAAQQQFLAAFDRPIASLVIATSNPHKDWQAERWAELGDALYEEFGLQPVLVGGRSERELETERVIMEKARHAPVSTLGEPLRALVGILEGSDLVVSLDTGPMHMAVAVGTPVVALMGYNNPKRIGPYRRFQDLVVDAYGDPGEDYPISRAHREGRMARITVAQVLEKVAVWKESYRRPQ